MTRGLKLRQAGGSISATLPDSTPLLAQRTAHGQTRPACRFTADLLAFCSMRVVAPHDVSDQNSPTSPCFAKVSCACSGVNG
jgi:hypothetical protein